MSFIVPSTLDSISIRRLLIAVLTVCCCGSHAQADNWPGWLGPDGSGVSAVADVPTRWSATENVAWQVELEGAGNSSPIVWEDRVIVTATTGIQHDTLHVLCYHRDDGRPLWETRLFASSTPLLFTMFPPQRGNALPTPCTDGHRIVALFGTGDLVCLDMDGNPLWFRSLSQQYGEFTNEYGIAASPVLADGKVVVQVDQAGESYLLALNGETGRSLWKTTRAVSDNWATPTVATIHGWKQVICSGTYRVSGYNLADGVQRWSAEGMARLCTPTPLVHGDDLIASSGPDGCVLALRFEQADGTAPKFTELWRNTRGAGFIPTGVRTDDLFFLVSDRGIGTCFDARTGQIQWQERIGGTFRASLIAAGGYVFFTSLEGVTTVVRAAPEYQLVSQNDVEQPIAATPAIARNALLLRTERQLICIRASDR